MRKEKGFSLIELLIVVAIILIIAAIAVPNLLRSRMAANEASAAGTLRTIGTANVTYLSTYNTGFAPALTNLGPAAGTGGGTSATADLLDSLLGGAASFTKAGYNFTYAAGTAPAATFQAVGNPQARGSSGQANFCTSEKLTVFKDAAAASNATATAGGTCAGSAL